jgi:hypothetical protein
MLIPDNDTAPDGQVHAEAGRDQPRTGGILGCLCGLTGTACDLDEHLLRVLAPVGMTGRDGQEHRPNSQNDTPPADGRGDRAPVRITGL